MKKLAAVLILVALAGNIFAQDRTGLPPEFKPLTVVTEFFHSIGYDIVENVSFQQVVPNKDLFTPETKQNFRDLIPAWQAVSGNQGKRSGGFVVYVSPEGDAVYTTIMDLGR